MNEPEKKPEPEIRGGDRPSDYMPEEGSGGFGLIGWRPDDDEPEDDEPPGGNDPEAQ